MKLRLLLLIVVACLFLIGCPAYSVHPLYTDHDAVVEPSLEGTWLGPDPTNQEEMTFKKVGDHEYSLTGADAKMRQVTQTYRVHMVRLGGQLFMDIIAYDQTINGVELDGQIGVIPTHVILKVKISGDDFAYSTLEDDAIKKQSAAGGAPLDYQIAEGAVLVTIPTDDLRRYISDHPDTLFSDSQHLKRKGKAATQS
jgi:hypothetical protein